MTLEITAMMKLNTMSLTPCAITAPMAFSARNDVWLLTPHGRRIRPNTETMKNSR